MTPTARFPDLEGACVLITGGGSGIGAALVESFAAQGARVAFLDIAAEPSHALVEELAGKGLSRPLFLQADLRDITALRAAVKEAAAAHGPATVLVNNAAWDDRHELDAVTVEYWDDNQAINLRSQFFAAQAVAPGMRAKGFGSIINFSSTSFLLNMGNMPAYTTAKAGIIGLTKGLAGKLGPDNIRVNAVMPGWVLTERQKALWVTEASLDAHVSNQCIRRPMQPVDMVGTILFLASDCSLMLTAQTLVVDGGNL